MSELLEHQDTNTHEPVSEDDLRRMYEDARTERDTYKRERDAEVSRRQMTEQERDAERAARLVTETAIDGANARIVTEQEQRYNAQKEALKNGITAQKHVIDSAEEAYARHAELGEWIAAGKAQRQMAEAAAKLTNLEEQHTFLETNKEKLLAPPSRPERREVVSPSHQGDPIAALVKDIMPGEREWLGKRPQFISDPSYRNQVFNASNFATSKGHARGSEAYFREIERVLGEATEPGTQVTREEPPRQQERQMSADIAPQRRASPGQQPSGGREIRLTAEQAEVADGLYGQPNSEDYLPDPADRYRKYWNNMEKRRLAGRM